MTQEAKEILEKHIEDIENNNFDAVFSDCVYWGVQTEVAEILTTAGISFLEHTSRIKEYLFMNSDIEKIVVPDNIKMIELGAFYSCADLTEVSLPKSLMMIGVKAFKDCRKLSKVTFRGTVSELKTVSMFCDSFENTPFETFECTDGQISKRKLLLWT